MLMAIHASAGAIVGDLSHTAVSAFTFSFILHFLMDLIPHGDHELSEQYKQKNQIGRAYAFVLSDIIATLTFIIAISVADLNFNVHHVTWGIIGGLLPDVLVGIYQITKVRILKGFYDFHFYIHGFFPEKKNKNISFVPGMVMQMILITFLIRKIF